MLSPDAFKEQYPPERLREELEHRAVSSLRDIQFLYGKLYIMATAGGGEYSPYLTPDAAESLQDTDESLIAVRVDLSGDQPQLDPETPVEIRRYTDDLVDKAAHSKYPAARGIDHSVTHQSGQDSDTEKLARYAQERLTKWATDDTVQEVAAETEDGWIIETLAELGDDVDVRDRIESEVEASLGGPTTALLTVRVKLDSGGEYLWPGEIEAFLEAMKQRNVAKLVAKNEATDSIGEAVDMVTAQEGTAVGMAEDPLKFYLGKQMEKFPNLDPDEAWRSHQVSEDTAITVTQSDAFVDACTYSTFGATIYYLPYFEGKVDTDEIYQLYRILYAVVVEDDEDQLSPVESAYEILKDDYDDYASRLRFYVAAVSKQQMSRFDVFGDTMHGALLYPVELDEAHANVLQSWYYSPPQDGISAALPQHENWNLLNDSKRLGAIASGAYFFETFAAGDDDQEAAADDIRLQALVSVLGGDPIAVETLIGEYVARIVQDESENFPSYLVASQHAQLCALASADTEPSLLTAETERGEAIASEPRFDTTMQETQPKAVTDGGSAALAREEKLDQFLQSHDAFEEDEEREATFLLGALVGQIGSYQGGHLQRSTTVIDQYNVKGMTKPKIKRITQEVLDKDLVYTRENDMSSTMYAEIVDRIVDRLANNDPDEWSIPTDELRYYYSLGIAYGMNNYTDTQETEQ